MENISCFNAFLILPYTRQTQTPTQQNAAERETTNIIAKSESRKAFTYLSFRLVRRIPFSNRKNLFFSVFFFFSSIFPKSADQHHQRIRSCTQLHMQLGENCWMFSTLSHSTEGKNWRKYIFHHYPSDVLVHTNIFFSVSFRPRFVLNEKWFFRIFRIFSCLVLNYATTQFFFRFFMLIKY